MENVDLTWLIVIAAFFILFYLVFYLVPIGLWFTAKISGVRITIMDLVFMRMRRVPQSMMVRSMIMAAKAGIIVEKDAMEAHCLAGGDVEKVVIGMITAKNKNISMTFKEASQMDLARKDIIQELSKL